MFSLFFQVRFFFDISLSFFFFYFLHGKLQHKWTFCLHFCFVFYWDDDAILGGGLTFRKQHSDLDLVDFIWDFWVFRTARVVEGSWRGRCCNLHTQLSTWGSFFSVVYVFFFILIFLKLGSLRLKWTISFLVFVTDLDETREKVFFLQIFVGDLNLRD